MLKELVKVAGRLDSLGLSSEANFIDAVVKKFAGDLVQFPKEVWQDKPKMKAKDIRAERKERDEERNAHQRMLEEEMRVIDERNYSPKGRHEYPSEEELAMEEEAYRADLEERKLKRPYSSDVDISSLGKDRGTSIADAYNMRGDFMGSKAPRKSKNRGLSTPFDDDDFSDDADDMFDSDGNLIDPIDFEQEVGDEDFDQYENPEETSFLRSESVAPRRGRSVYVPSDDANDMQRLARRLSSIGLTKEARILSSIVKSASDDYYSDEETDEPSYYSEDEAIASIDNRKDLIRALEMMSDRTFGFLRVTYPEAMEAILQRTEGERATPEQIHKRKLRENSNVNKYYSKKANLNYLAEEEFSDDAWDDGDTGPYHYRDPRVDEEAAEKKRIEKQRREEEMEAERKRINLSYYGHEEGNAGVYYSPTDKKWFPGGHVK
jgi:hypothetical protein